MSTSESFNKGSSRNSCNNGLTKKFYDKGKVNNVHSLS